MRYRIAPTRSARAPDALNALMGVRASIRYFGTGILLGLGNAVSRPRSGRNVLLVEAAERGVAGSALVGAAVRSSTQDAVLTDSMFVQRRADYSFPCGLGLVGVADPELGTSASP